MQNSDNIPHATYSPFYVDALPFVTDIEMGLNSEDIERIDIKSNIMAFQISAIKTEIEIIKTDILKIKKDLAPSYIKAIDWLIVYTLIIVVYLKAFNAI